VIASRRVVAAFRVDCVRRGARGGAEEPVMICKYCGQPTTELFTMSGDRVYIHFECMLKRGGEIIESGADDDLAAGIAWPDRPPQIVSGEAQKK
jgi:hypothetical protein